MSNSLLSSAVIAVIIVIVSGYVISYSVDTDTVADIIFTGILDVAYAAHGVLSLNATDSIDDLDDAALKLDGAWYITTFKSGVQTYAVVTTFNEDGVQILNITNPSNITPTGSIVNSNDLELDGPRGIARFESGTDTYVIVAAHIDDGVQILNITDPTKIIPAGNITDNPTDLKLKRASDIAVFKSGKPTHMQQLQQILMTESRSSTSQILPVLPPQVVSQATEPTLTALSLTVHGESPHSSQAVIPTPQLQQILMTESRSSISPILILSLPQAALQITVH